MPSCLCGTPLKDDGNNLCGECFSSLPEEFGWRSCSLGHPSTLNGWKRRWTTLIHYSCKLVQRVDIPDDGSVEGVCNDAWDAAAARGLIAPQEAA